MRAGGNQEYYEADHQKHTSGQENGTRFSDGIYLKENIGI